MKNMPNVKGLNQPPSINGSKVHHPATNSAAGANSSADRNYHGGHMLHAGHPNPYKMKQW